MNKVFISITNNDTKLQLKKVDPFITKRAHQISVTWAHGPGPYLIIPRKYPAMSSDAVKLTVLTGQVVRCLAATMPKDPVRIN